MELGLIVWFGLLAVSLILGWLLGLGTRRAWRNTKRPISLKADDAWATEDRQRLLDTIADLDKQLNRQRRSTDRACLGAKDKALIALLPAIDSLERAIEHTAQAATQQANVSQIVEGVQLVLRQFMSAFERLDVTPVEAAGQPFDPNLHEAISQAESDQPPGTVVQVLQRGYRSADRLLRPALVVVAKARK